MHVCVYVHIRMRACMRACMCAHDVCLFGARPSGHPLTVNNEHGTYDRCVGDGGYTGCLRSNPRLPRIARLRMYVRVSERAKWKKRARRDTVKKNSLTLVLESALSSFLSLFRAVEV